VLLFSDNDGERQRLAEILSTLDEAAHTGRTAGGRIQLGVGRLGAGFRLTAAGVTVLANHEVFHRYHDRRRMRRQIETRALDTWLDLKRGDYVVHAIHGIGKNLGMKTLSQGAVPAFRKRGLSPFWAAERVQSPFRNGAKRVQPP
jgi:transcription-repair coupling factor (superfamily II helicase)